MTETVQVRFQQATQSTGESLEDWADRVLTLASKAFKELPEKHSNQQAVIRFCQGLLDKEAGQHVCTLKPCSVEDAIDKVRWYQHVHQAIYGKSRSKRCTRDHEEKAANVYSVQENRGPSRRHSTSQRESVSNTFEATLEKGQQQIEKLSSDVQILFASREDRRQRPQYRRCDGACYTCGKKGHFKKDCTRGVCYSCGEKGHFRKNCPIKGKQARNISKVTNLNMEGSGSEAESRP